MWKLLLGRLPTTREDLARRNLLPPGVQNICACCNTGEESINHLFLNYKSFLLAVKDFDPDCGDSAYNVGIVDLLLKCVELCIELEKQVIVLLYPTDLVDVMVQEKQETEFKVWISITRWKKTLDDNQEIYHDHV
ncbi:hypothetical protein RIF29_07808 [Crotalaria pallida]|uniref:Reverse transcriptase zinc-binding domain-containing protein n=1 Tax=Crotalaria pallida TaxID=3830 RepID=A0AAN9J5N9_CROPI